ncbi:MAG TPA: anion transporter [Gemmatimonadaceae bacterium]|nr:anion transporter [Gemmatimonadaceae bacterium]
METTRLVIFLLTYLLIAVQQVPGLRLNRPAASLLGAVAMIAIGGLTLEEAYAAVDLDVIVFLLGVLLLTGYLELGGFFEWAAAGIVARMHSARTLLAALVGTSGVLSAFFINDTICLVFTPLILAALRPLGLPPIPFLLAIALSANVGSAMTITGNPQNMLIGIASGIGYARFAASLALPALGGLVIVYLVLARVHRADLSQPLTRTVRVEGYSVDRTLITRALLVFGGALAGWLAGFSLPLVAIAAGALMIAIAQRDPAEAFARVEWSLLLFFAAIFIVMQGVRDLPLVESLTDTAAGRLGGAPWRDAGITSAAMLALSNLVSNVPAVILWLPIVPRLADADFIWLVLAMSSTFAGNLTLLGSMANLIVAERAQARGVHLGFGAYLRVGVPVTLLTLVWGIVVLVLTVGR